ncbi:MAG TPA: hypothetical protein VEW03_15270 [Longimicrobiaceae bacterium]|nr:hypothetical protein [Longimicrobiaceae bacterium]
MTLVRRSPACSLACSLACLTAACTDLATGPDTYVHEAGGSVWVAVSAPAGLPDASTWVPYLVPGSEAAEVVVELRAAAVRARRAGDLERAAALDGEAARTAAGAVSAAPPAVALLGALAALDVWGERAAGRLQAGSYPDLDAAAARVRTLRDAARASLAGGDSVRAVLELTDAAETARGFAPQAVALRLVGQAQRRIEADPDPSPNLRRARRLLFTAREAMATGNQTRAMQRAWYALQLIEAEEAAARPPQ